MALDVTLIAEVLEFRGRNGMDTVLSPANALALVEYLRTRPNPYVPDEKIHDDIARAFWPNGNVPNEVRRYCDGAEYSLDA